MTHWWVINDEEPENDINFTVKLNHTVRFAPESSSHTRNPVIILLLSSTDRSVETALRKIPG